MASVETKFEAHIRRYRDQAEKLKKSLKRRNLIRNPERLDALFRQAPPLKPSTCPSESGEESYEWSYEVHDVALTLSGLRHPMPSGAAFCTGHGLLSCKVTEYFCPSRQNGVGGIMPIKSVELNFVIQGKLDVDGASDALIACWHVDTHSTNTDKTAEELHVDVEGKTAREDNHALHPLFHYQFGGRKLREAAPQVRGVLVLDAPRLPIPPLDLNLAIDFVVTNYAGANWQALRRDTQYAHPIRDSMRRIWGPYYACLASHFTQGPPTKPPAVFFMPDFL